MAEKEAIKFVGELPEEEKFGLIRICPGFIFAPVQSNTYV
jgi:hypothetical protein